MTRYLFLCAIDASLLQIVDEKLVPPTGSAPGVGRPGTVPVLAQTWDDELSEGRRMVGGEPTLDEHFFDEFGPNLACAVFEELPVFPLGGEGRIVVGGGSSL
jgi:hypothetical protein